MKKLLLFSLLIFSANTFGMNRMVNKATRISRFATFLKNKNLRTICINRKDDGKCCYCSNKNETKKNMFDRDISDPEAAKFVAKFSGLVLGSIFILGELYCMMTD